MSFDPLPASLLTVLHRTRDGRILDLGCADGQLARLLDAQGAQVVGLDRMNLSGEGGFPFVVGDATRPPLRPAAWDLVIVANLLRHLPGAANDAELWYSWFDLLAAGGAFFVLEDEPAATAGPAGHYSRLQALLAGLPGRGPLLPLADFRRLCRRGAVRIAEDGWAANRYPMDAGAVVEMLASGKPPPGSEAAILAADIARDGIAAGHYWWARVERRQVS
ncbi:MAG: class I SAM-dependent methyltransferase [bacterium]|nr:class I SAM-dependent methyltransferase [bacterium]